jgi:hypothetical protein
MEVGRVSALPLCAFRTEHPYIRMLEWYAIQPSPSRVILSSSLDRVKNFLFSMSSRPAPRPTHPPLCS